MPPVRRLTAIFAADVAGYSRLMGADEEGTHERLKAHLGELVNPKIKAHRGRTVKNTGDGFLAEFQSVVDAVRCAVEVQRGMADREPAVPEERQIRFRIGINLGDVIAEGEDIFGDGVNVAARLQALAEPGGICVSRVVRDQVRDKVDFGFEDLGEQQVKNITRPVRVYALRPETIAKLPMASAPPAALISKPAAAPRLSIVVLPFTNLSDDREQQYFADGITEDLTTDLSRLANMCVISRNTAFTYRNKPVDTKQIGRELYVRYVLEGSARRSGNKVRVNAQLIDAEADVHLWAERFDGDTSDLFTLQDAVTRRIAVALNIELVAAEATRRTEHPDALDYILRGRAASLKPFTPDSYAEAIVHFERALALDPGSVEAQSLLAGLLAGRAMEGMTTSQTADIERAKQLARQALAASPRSPLAHYARGQVLRAQDRRKEAVPEFEAAIAFNRNWLSVISFLADCKLHVGPIEEVIPLVEEAIRLSPRDPAITNMYGRIAIAHLLQSRLDEAIIWSEKTRDANPARAFPHSALAAAFALKGETERAAAELAEARRLNYDFYRSITGLRARYSEVPEIEALFEATYGAGAAQGRNAGGVRASRLGAR